MLCGVAEGGESKSAYGARGVREVRAAYGTLIGTELVCNIGKEGKKSRLCTVLLSSKYTGCASSARMEFRGGCYYV